MSDDEIDQHLERLYQRWQRLDRADSGWLDAAEMGVHLQPIMDAMLAYFEAVGRYGRQAPSVREEHQHDNAAWN